jgi:hypothetical protein
LRLASTSPDATARKILTVERPVAGEPGVAAARGFASPLNGSIVRRIRMRNVNHIIIATVAVATIGSWIAFRARAQKTRSSGAAPSSKKDPANIGRDLRRMALSTSPQDMGVKPSKEFPRIYAVLMDWPIGEQIATVFSSSAGAASLYTTSKFGVIGGEGHETVRAAAKALVKASDRHFAAATPTSEFPYPREGHSRFYFITFDGVRVIDTDSATITSGKSEYAELFELGQGVLTEMRLLTEKSQ